MLIGEDDISNDVIFLARVFQRLFTFALVFASRWLAKIWQLSRRGATGELEVEFKFQRRSCKFSFPPRRQSELARRLTLVAELSAILANRPIPSLCFKARLSAKPLTWRWFFYSYTNKTYFHNTGFALSLVLKEELIWPCLRLCQRGIKMHYGTVLGTLSLFCKVLRGFEENWVKNSPTVKLDTRETHFHAQRSANGARVRTLVDNMCP